ncbi:hypothetical protein [Fulvimonas yonginensis]|uniref:Uncharacterized protein n=1 Tax=Fulvimonas yonginensis TaxID=1495200 RepID=A0ABU8JB17_9GAMM
MKVLKGIQEAIELRLQRQSVAVLETARKVAKCVTYLHVHGCTVQQVVIRPDYAVIDIDQPSEWLKGSIAVRRVRGDQRELQMVTKVLDCQVQWIVREAHPLLRREG